MPEGLASLDSRFSLNLVFFAFFAFFASFVGFVVSAF